ncbi:hypothetical protein EB796_000989 [Bugula neritina]|uniref:Uncharacterized protein n=1 Tax=Bugula neritina TaxID=10212 RepID=A0A7J7KRC9_BUGNE|nr:hypothetical protein EB796_000989 [Bugula neritina]
MNRATIEDLYVLQQGNYVMAIGDLLENKDVPTLLTRKLKLLEKNKTELASLWPLEVQHQLKYAPLSQQ